MDDNEDDTHLCLRCSATISGLKNYVAHRKHNCSKTARDSNAIASSPMPEQHYEPSALTADDFFSSLELQSIQAVVPSDAHGSSAANKSSHADDDLEEAEDSDNDLYPPMSHTGGKWKPGCRPDGRSQWKATLFPADHPHESREPSSTIKEFFCVPCRRLYRNKSRFSRHQQTSYHLKRAGTAPAFQLRTSQRLLSSLSAANHSRFTTRSLVQGAKVETCKNVKKSNEVLPFSCLACDENLSAQTHLNHHTKAKDVQNKASSQTKQHCHVCGYQCHCDNTQNFHICKPKQHDTKCTSTHSPSAPSANDPSTKIKDSARTKEKDEQQMRHMACKIDSATNMDRELDESQCATSGSGLDLNVSKIMIQNQTEGSLKTSTKDTYNGIARLPCPYCQQLVSKSYFKLHMNKHTGAKPFSCRLCGRTFAHRSTLSVHMKHHLGIRKFQCPQCDFRAVRSSMLRRHELTKHSSAHSAQTYSSDTCGSKHSSRETVQRHTTRHGVKHTCSVTDCGRIFEDASSLERHSRSHDDARPYLCDTCGHTTRSAHQLVKHQRRHTGERPFKCPHCDYKASRSSQLHRHSRVHTGLKPYSCPYCSYKCSNQENIRKHILKTKKHAGKEMYPCSDCNFSCNDFNGYRNHVHQNHWKDSTGKDVSDPLVGAKTGARQQSGSINSAISGGSGDAQRPRGLAIAKSRLLPEPALFPAISELSETDSNARLATAPGIALLTERAILTEGSRELVTCAQNDLTDATEGILLPGGLDGDLNDQLSKEVNFSGLESEDTVYVLNRTVTWFYGFLLE